MIFASFDPDFQIWSLGTFGTFLVGWNGFYGCRLDPRRSCVASVALSCLCVGIYSWLDDFLGFSTVKENIMTSVLNLACSLLFFSSNL